MCLLENLSFTKTLTWYFIYVYVYIMCVRAYVRVIMSKKYETVF